MFTREEKIEALSNLLETNSHGMSDEELKLIIRSTLLEELVETRNDIIAILELRDRLFFEQKYLMRVHGGNDKLLESVRERIDLQNADLIYCGKKVLMTLHWIFEADCALQEFCEVLGFDFEDAEKFLSKKYTDEIIPFLRLIVLFDIEAPNVKILTTSNYDKTKPLKTSILEALVARMKEIFN